ncbi:MAG: M1 family metallopeptidase [Candidatus Vogelbacteria bacterium]|nr:M1 family metallopeptidase [Candidatus Vogelbacteria bacterium]
MKKNKVLLPAHVNPERYRLIIHPNLSDFTFKGEETAYLKVSKPTKDITFHSVEIKMEHAFVTAGKTKQVAHKIKYDEGNETVTFSFQKTVSGKVELNLKFTGIINDQMRGFYRSSYKLGEETIYMATTQFEATDARRAFPCIDEPASKAVFDITLIIPKGKTAISNTYPVAIKEHEGGYQMVQFAPTPKMSTYLAAYIVGDFEFVERKTESGIIVRVFSTSGKKSQGDFAVDTCVKMVNFYEKYFDIKFPIPVLDLVAIPDFNSGAMENWGAITYRETALLIDPDNSSAATKERVALVIAHELAHMWFGNLVTMQWWTHLWLNEGFASWIEYLAIDHVFPEWNIWVNSFQSADRQDVLYRDALKTTHPIEIPVKHPREIRDIFDMVSYEKGSSVIHMLNSYLGEDKFMKGLRLYLKKHKYDNAETGDLWAALSKASGKDVKSIMANWTGKSGYPVVRVEETKGGFRLNQSRFFSSGKVREKTKDKTVWKVPLSIKLSGNKEIKKIIFGKKTDVMKMRLSLEDWLKFNVGETSFTRIGYSSRMMEMLGRAIAEKKISEVDRMGLIADAFALARSGVSDTEIVLSLLKAYEYEDSYAVWREISAGLNSLGKLFEGEVIYPKFAEFVRGMYSHMKAVVGFERKNGDGHTASLLRELVLSQLSKYGDREIVNWARGKFEDFLKDKKTLHPDLRRVVLNTVAREGGEKEYEEILKLYKEATLQEEKNRLAIALGQFRDDKLILKTLAFSISDEVRKQDSIIVLDGVSANGRAGNLIWKFGRDNWKVLYERYGHTGWNFYRIIESLTAAIISYRGADEVEAFIKKQKLSGGERAIAQTLERIRGNAYWKDKAEKQLQDFLKVRN